LTEAVRVFSVKGRLLFFPRTSTGIAICSRHDRRFRPALWSTASSRPMCSLSSSACLIRWNLLDYLPDAVKPSNELEARGCAPITRSK
jgi:hypothetical protein